MKGQSKRKGIQARRDQAAREGRIREFYREEIGEDEWHRREARADRLWRCTAGQGLVSGRPAHLGPERP